MRHMLFICKHFYENKQAKYENFIRNFEARHHVISFLGQARMFYTEIIKYIVLPE